MKNGEGKYGIFSRVLDGILIAAVFLLIGYSAWRSAGLGLSGRRSVANEVEKAKPPAQEEKAVPETPPTKRQSRVVNGIRVSNGVSMERMASDDWSGVRTAPAMDMRENGKSFEVVFVLSDKVDPESIRSSMEGNVLRLSMIGATGKKETKKVMIPGFANLEGARIQNLVTNGLLRVKIEP